jgi:pimeloyl-ACP methyl ester carboxylesterase
MNTQLVTTTTLVTQDGVPIEAVHLPGPAAQEAPATRAIPGTLATPATQKLPTPLTPAAPASGGDLAIVMAHGFTGSWQRPMVWDIAKRFTRTAGVVTFDFRGHGRSGGLSTLGDKEIDDLDVAIRYARHLGYERVATVGFSMGASVVLRHGGLIGGVEAVVSVSGPGHWFYRGTKVMRRVHFAAEKRLGRLFAQYALNTRISPDGWPIPEPMPPAEAAARISPVPVLIVHGEADIFFPPDHGRELYDGAREPKELWMLPGFGHAERATDDALTDRLAAWVASAVTRQGAAPEAAPETAAAS